MDEAAYKKRIEDLESLGLALVNDLNSIRRTHDTLKGKYGKAKQRLKVLEEANRLAETRASIEKKIAAALKESRDRILSAIDDNRLTSNSDSYEAACDNNAIIIANEIDKLIEETYGGSSKRGQESAGVDPTPVEERHIGYRGALSGRTEGKAAEMPGAVPGSTNHLERQTDEWLERHTKRHENGNWFSSDDMMDTIAMLRDRDAEVARLRSYAPHPFDDSLPPYAALAKAYGELECENDRLTQERDAYREQRNYWYSQAHSAHIKKLSAELAEVSQERDSACQEIDEAFEMIDYRGPYDIVGEPALVTAARWIKAKRDTLQMDVDRLTKERDEARANADFLRQSVGECHVMISRNSADYQITTDWSATDLPPRLRKLMLELDRERGGWAALERLRDKITSDDSWLRLPRGSQHRATLDAITEALAARPAQGKEGM